MPPPPKIVLSGAQGFCAQAGGIDVAAGWLLLSRKGVVAISEFVTSNPAMSRGRAALDAVEALYLHMEVYAKHEGCPVLFTSTPAAGSLARFLEKRGWLPCKGEPHCHMVKV
jgi:hypothetical protein